jgi:phosphohistidine phosphatase
MARILILMRHAIPDMSAFVEDALIPISESGKILHKRVAESLKKSGYLPDRIVYSPYQRTKESAALLGEVFNVPPQEEPLLALGKDADRAFEKYKEYSGTTILVGHLPSLLHIAQRAAGKTFTTLHLERSGAIIIDMEANTPPLYLSPKSC